jgi:hypothetical protein
VEDFFAPSSPPFLCHSPLLEKAYLPFSFSNHFGEIIGEVNDAGMFGDNDPSINDKVQLFSKAFFDLGGIIV